MKKRPGLAHFLKNNWPHSKQKFKASCKLTGFTVYMEILKLHVMGYRNIIKRATKDSLPDVWGLFVVEESIGGTTGI